MGLYFPKMRMPESCAACPLVKLYGLNLFLAEYRCGAAKLPSISYAEAYCGRRPDCPAQEMFIGIDLAEPGKDVSV